MADPAVLSTLRTLVAGPSGSPASTPDATSFSIGFLAALGAKELEDQAAGFQREQSKQAKSQASNAQMAQGNLGQADQLVTLARFAQSGLLPQMMGGAQGPSPLTPTPTPTPPQMGPMNPMTMMAAGRPPLPMAGPAPMGPGAPPPAMGAGAPMAPPPGGVPMGGPPPQLSAPQGAIPPAILMALQSLVRPTGGLV